MLGVSVAAVVASSLQVLLERPDQGFFLPVLCLLVCFVAAWLDVATRRIPNVLTYPAIVLGLVLNVVAPLVLVRADLPVAVVWLGSHGALDGGLGFGVAAGIGVVSFLARGLGGGDVKLLGAVGAMLGLGLFVPVFVNTLVVAAVLGLLNWAFRGTLVPRIQVVAGNVLAALFTGQPLKGVYPFGRTESPFGVALLIGVASAPFFSILHLLLRMGL
jgi:prepilin peptidase CpaA